jgi:dTMP kinase
MLISIEGIDFAGKTTQTQLLSNWFLSQNLSVETFKSPNTDLFTGKLLSEYLREEISLPHEAAFALFSANRLEMKPALVKAIETLDAVICDRYSETEYAYGLARGLHKEWLFELESQVPPANLVLLLDISVSTTVKRYSRDHPLDMIEKDLYLLERCRHFYLNLPKELIASRQKWVVINGENSIREVHDEIVDIVGRL